MEYPSLIVIIAIVFMIASSGTMYLINNSPISKNINIEKFQALGKTLPTLCVAVLLVFITITTFGFLFDVLLALAVHG